jgi:UDP-N-acetylmuramate dehydrogenase
MNKIQKNVALAPYTYYQIGGKAKYFCEIDGEREAIEALEFAKDNNVRFFILGGGANVLISDAGFDGLAIKIKNNNKKLEVSGNKIKVSAGTRLANLVNFSLRSGLSGLGWAAGLPGTIGGAIRGNAGAFNHSISESVEGIEVIQAKSDKSEYKIRTFNNKQCRFGYRTSIIKEKGGIILSVAFVLKKLKTKNERIKIVEDARKNMQYRKEHQPLEYPSCGSVFKNVRIADVRSIEKIKGIAGMKGETMPAGLLIEKAGLKGRRIGGAQISEKHANFIVNLGNAKAKDVYDLIELCEQEVHEKFGARLEREVEMIGF